MTFMKALLTYLKLSSETTAEFAAQIKRLADSDKAWLRQAFIDQGIDLI